jgi:hypothetical protein
MVTLQQMWERVYPRRRAGGARSHRLQKLRQARGGLTHPLHPPGGHYPILIFQGHQCDAQAPALGSHVGHHVHDERCPALSRSSAARGASRVNPLPHLFRANYACEGTAASLGAWRKTCEGPGSTHLAIGIARILVQFMNGLPVSCATISMQSSTGQVIWHRLQPTHSSSITCRHVCRRP